MPALRHALPILAAVFLIFSLGAPVVARAQASAATLDGKWTYEGTCRGRRTLIQASVFHRGQSDNDWGLNIAYFAWDGERTGSMYESWVGRGVSSGGRLSIDPFLTYSEQMMQRREPNRYQWFPVVFEQNGGQWSGVVHDPSCGGRAILRRPTPAPTIGRAGNALTAAAWAGRSPLAIVGGQDFFAYQGFPFGAVSAQERSASTRWAPVTAVTVRQSAVIVAVEMRAWLTTACVGGSCDAATGGRTFLVFGAQRAGERRALFASRIAPGQMQICSLSQTWQCWRTRRAPPVGLSAAALAQWIWDANGIEVSAWERAHPGVSEDCRTVTERLGPRPSDTVSRRICTPGRRGAVPPALPRL